MNRPQILVVMPLYNAASYVKKAIDSILTQSFSNFELLIINDGSTDTSMQEVSSILDDRMIVWEQENQGPGASMNRAIKYTSEREIPYIARMDADDISLPARLDIQYHMLERNRNFAACSCNCYYIDSLTEEILGSSTTNHRPKIVNWEIQNGLRGLIQGATLFRTSALIKVGGYRLEFKYAEETDLFLRLSEGYELTNSKEYLYKIRLMGNSLSTTDVKKNLLYHFYALDCSKNRNANKQMLDFETFQKKKQRRLSYQVNHEEYILRLWRSNLTRRKYLSLLWISLLDPRRSIARILRKI